MASNSVLQQQFYTKDCFILFVVNNLDHVSSSTIKMKNNGHTKKKKISAGKYVCESCIHLKIIDYRHTITRQSKTENVFCC